MELFEVSGEGYYFDLEKIGDFIRLEKKDDVDDLLGLSSDNEEVEGSEENPTYDEGPMIDMIKWEMTKAMIETVLSEVNPVDESMGIQKTGEQLSIPFRISFNTLLINKLLKKQ